jgi:hypothetical protein
MGKYLLAIVLVTVLPAAGRALPEGSPAGAASALSAEERVRNVIACMETGMAKYDAGEYLKAAIEFEKVLLLDPYNTAAGDYINSCEEKLNGR